MSRNIVGVSWISLGLGLILAVTSPARAQNPAAAQPGGDPIAIVNGARVITGKDIDSAAGRDLYVLEERIYALRKKA
ncbi:MAG TPA: hypothetical protein VI756_05875, partial [Blastocatellia bacterium]